MDVLQQLADALGTLQKQGKGMHTKVGVGNQNASILLQQPGGMFSIAGMDRVVISTHIAPAGLGNVLPAFANNLTDPRFGLITGFGAETGVEAVYPCDDAPVGYMKSGTLTAQFGRIMRQTHTIEIDSLLQEQRNSTMGLQLIGEMLGSGPISPDISQDGLLELVVKSEMVTVGVGFERKLATMLWNGSPAANTVGGGYKEFPGLDAQIATGQVDTETNTLIPSANSLIVDFGSESVDSTTRDIVQELSYVEFYLRTLAKRTGLEPATWAVVMRPELWFELSAVWPCRYMTDRCSNGSANPVVINDDANVRLRDEMRSGSYIIINGRQYPVIEDDGLNEFNSTNKAGLLKGEFSGSIYFVPLRVRGSFPVLYWEHIDYRRVSGQLGMLGQGMRNIPFWTENGKFLWVYRDNSFCFDLQAKVEPRVVLRTPHLAAKIQNVKYSPLLHLRDALPSSAYWVDGGVSTRPLGTSYAVWK